MRATQTIEMTDTTEIKVYWTFLRSLGDLPLFLLIGGIVNSWMY